MNAAAPVGRVKLCRKCKGTGRLEEVCEVAPYGRGFGVLVVVVYVTACPCGAR